jgi:hypothetical protein
VVEPCIAPMSSLNIRQHEALEVMRYLSGIKYKIRPKCQNILESEPLEIILSPRNLTKSNFP